MTRCLQCGQLAGACRHDCGTYEDGLQPGPEGQFWLGIAAAVLVVAFVLVVWQLAAVAA